MESGRDTLTRLLNRRFLSSVMQSMIKSARATSSTFSVLSLDLDGLKQINDRYGHDIGDKALVFFGDLLLYNTRVTDYVFRMGGDEFLVVFAGLDAMGGRIVAQKLQEKMSSQPLILDNGSTLQLKISIGIVEYEGHLDYLRLLKDVDDALYQAKANGRNTVFIEE